MCQEVVVNTLKPSTQQAGAGESLSATLVWSTVCILGEPEITDNR